MKKSPLFTKTFFSIVVFFMLSMIVVGIIFNYNILSYTESEISKSSIGQLSVSKNITEKSIEGIIKETIRLTENRYYFNANLVSYAEGLSAVSNPNKPGDILGIYGVLSEMNRFLKSYGEINSIYIYLEDADVVLSTKYGPQSVKNFMDTEWLSRYKESKPNGFSPFWMKSRMPYNNEQGNDESKDNDALYDHSYVLTYVYPLSMPLTIYSSQIRGAIIVNLYVDKLSDQINGKDMDNPGTIYIINPNGDVMVHGDKSMLGKNIKGDPAIQKIIESKSEKGYIMSDKGNSRQIITYYKSDLNQWIFVGVFQMDTLMTKVKRLQMNILYIMLAILFIGVALSYFISRTIYSPVRKLVQDIKNQKGIDILGEKNEVSILSKAFDTILKEENQLSSTLEKQKKHLRENYILGLLNGNLDDREEQVPGTVDFPFPYYLCIITTIGRYKDFTANVSKEQQYYFKTLVMGIFEEVLNQSFKCSGVLLEKEKMVFIVNTYEPGFDTNVHRIKQSFTIIKKEIAKIMDNPVTISVGSIQDNLTEIKTSYSEAMDILKLKLITGHGSVISYQESWVDGRKYSYPFTLEKHIMNNLSAGTKEAILTSVGEFIDDIKNNNELSYDNTILMLNQLLGSTVRYLLDCNISISEVFGNDFNIYKQLLDNETLDDVGIWFARIYLHIMKYTANTKADHTKYIDAAMDYIHKNYKKDIDVNVLAEHIGISYSQLRRVFLNVTGNNMVDYINSLRIEEAKRLLCQTDSNILEIALNLGYNNDRSFNRFFKKFEGITPGEFRRINKG